MQGELNMNLIIEVKTVYGNRLVYPICKKAIALCQITNQKTFSQFAINKLKEKIEGISLYIQG